MVDTLTAFGRNKQERRIRDELKSLTYLPREVIERLVIFDNQVPFIDENTDAFVLFENHARDVRVLSSDALFGIDEQHRNVGTINCTQCTQDAVLFDAWFDPTATAHTRSINQHPRLTIDVDWGINGIACRPWDRRYNAPLIADQLVQER